MLLCRRLFRNIWVDPLSSFNPKRIFSLKSFYKRTKIVGTIGPASSDPEMIAKLVGHGLNVCRLNFSHGTHESQAELVRIIREGLKNNARPFGIPILMDLKGPSIRSGFLKNEAKKVFLKKHSMLEITTDYSHLGDENKIACSYTHLARSVNPKDVILMADGTLTLIVVEVQPTNGLILTRVLNDFWLGEKKNMNLPKKKIELPTITEKDKRDLRDFAREQDIDMISVSFCRSANDIETAREILGVRGSLLIFFLNITPL